MSAPPSRDCRDTNFGNGDQQNAPPQPAYPSLQRHHEYSDSLRDDNNRHMSNPSAANTCQVPQAPAGNFSQQQQPQHRYHHEAPPPTTSNTFLMSYTALKEPPSALTDSVKGISPPSMTRKSSTAEGGLDLFSSTQAFEDDMNLLTSKGNQKRESLPLSQDFEPIPLNEIIAGMPGLSPAAAIKSPPSTPNVDEVSAPASYNTSPSKASVPTLASAPTSGHLLTSGHHSAATIASTPGHHSAATIASSRMVPTVTSSILASTAGHQQDLAQSCRGSTASATSLKGSLGYKSTPSNQNADYSNEAFAPASQSIFSRQTIPQVLTRTPGHPFASPRQYLLAASAAYLTAHPTPQSTPAGTQRQERAMALSSSGRIAKTAGLEVSWGKKPPPFNSNIDVALVSAFPNIFSLAVPPLSTPSSGHSSVPALLHSASTSTTSHTAPPATRITSASTRRQQQTLAMSNKGTKTSVTGMEGSWKQSCNDLMNTGGEGSWERKFKELNEYKRSHGHCEVPQNYTQNVSLGIWVNKQRMEHKKRMEGKHSSLTESRLEQLQSIGFRWAKRKGQASWDEKFDELVAYKARFGNCDVPTKYKDNTALGRWVSTQRSEYKKYQKGKAKTAMNENKIQRLERIGFAWFKAL